MINFNEMSLADKCKWFENNFSPDVMIPLLPVIIRIDGANFSKYTKNFDKPYDLGFSELMELLTKRLVEETNAVIGYTQSDEITLVLYSNDMKSAIYHNGKKQKILSKLTSFVSNVFNENRSKFINNDKFAMFDMRIYQVPTLEWATSQLLWRENDCTRNSIQMLARSVFSHSECDNLNTDELQDKLMLEKNINWNDVDIRFKRGVYVRRTKVTSVLSKDEIASLPEKHNARLNPDMVFTRNVIQRLDVPIFSKIKNKVEFVFNGDDILV